jgi:L-amino acid N-acyltransferase YncA
MNSVALTVRPATFEDVPAILAIYNDAVANTTAIWNDGLADLGNRRAWLSERQGKGFPVLVACLGGEVAGYASYGDWRAWDGYRHTVEHSIYVRADLQRRGAGRALLAALIDAARAGGKHAMVAGIEAGNVASIRLHESLGFKAIGTFPQVGTKFGRWLDLTMMQLTLD